MLRQQNGVVTLHLGHPSIDPALDGYPTKKNNKNKLFGHARLEKTWNAPEALSNCFSKE